MYIRLTPHKATSENRRKSALFYNSSLNKRWQQQKRPSLSNKDVICALTQEKANKASLFRKRITEIYNHNCIQNGSNMGIRMQKRTRGSNSTNDFSNFFSLHINLPKQGPLSIFIYRLSVAKKSLMSGPSIDLQNHWVWKNHIRQKKNCSSSFIFIFLKNSIWFWHFFLHKKIREKLATHVMENFMILFPAKTFKIRQKCVPEEVYVTKIITYFYYF